MYIYQADCFCDDCGKVIRVHLNAQGKKPKNVEDERSYDSDVYPKYAGPDDDHGESDTPCHCGKGENCLNAENIPGFGKVGKLLGTNLTQEGVNYVRESMAQRDFETNKVTRFWASRFGPHYPEIRTVAMFAYGDDFFRRKK